VSNDNPTSTATIIVIIMNRNNNVNKGSNVEENQPAIIRLPEPNSNEERLINVSHDATESNHALWLMAGPKVSWDESDRHTVLSPSCTINIKLSPPPLLPSHNNNNIYRSSNDDGIDFDLPLPSLDLLGDFNQPVFRLKQRKSIVRGNNSTGQWRLRHSTTSDLTQRPHLRHRQHLQRTSTSSCSSSVQQPQLQEAASHAQQGQQQHQPQQEQQQHCENETGGEDVHLSQRQRIISWDQPNHQSQQPQQLNEEGTEEEYDELSDLLLWK
jgi:hypothetical protein